MLTSKQRRFSGRPGFILWPTNLTAELVIFSRFVRITTWSKSCHTYLERSLPINEPDTRHGAKKSKKVQKIAITRHKVRVNKATEIKNVPFSWLGPSGLPQATRLKNPQRFFIRDLALGQCSITVLGYAQSRSIHAYNGSEPRQWCNKARIGYRLKVPKKQRSDWLQAM